MTQPPEKFSPRSIDPRSFTTITEYQQGLKSLMERAAKTPGTVAARSGHGIGRTTVYNNVNDVHKLASEHATRWVVQVCAPDDGELLARWLEARTRLELQARQESDEPPLQPEQESEEPALQPGRPGGGPGGQPGDAGGHGAAQRGAGWASWIRGHWWLVVTCALILVAALTGMRIWSSERSAAKCGTSEPALTWVKKSRECAGLWNGSGDLGVFGPRLKPVLSLIANENTTAMEGSHVTVAFMAPLTSTDDRVVAEIEGAFIAQHQQNAKPEFPKIKLVLANMGHDEAQWRKAVTPLEAMTKGPEHLLAVTGLGLSQAETAQAARQLAKTSFPMVGDITTADGLNQTGAIDGGGPIPGLVRVATGNKDQLEAISKYLRTSQPKTAALIRVSVNHQGSSDTYASTLVDSFHNNPVLNSYLDPELNGLPFDPSSEGASESFKSISHVLCEPSSRIKLVYFTGRADDLDQFLHALHDSYVCNEKQFIVVSGSDAAKLRKAPDLYDPKSPVLSARLKVVYTPLADPQQLQNSSNHVYQEFNTAFTGQPFSSGDREYFNSTDLDTGWAILANDAVLTAITAILNASDGTGTPTPKLPDLRAVRDQLGYFVKNNKIDGASGSFNINSDGDRVNSQPPTHPLTLPDDNQ